MNENTHARVQIVRRQCCPRPFRLLDVCEDMHRTAAAGRHVLEQLSGTQKRSRGITARLGHANRLEEIQQVLFVGGHATKAGRRRVRHKQYHRGLSAFIHILQEHACTLKRHTQFSAITARDLPRHGAGVVDHNHDRLITAQAQKTAHSRKRHARQGKKQEQQQQRSGRQEERLAKLAMKRQSRFHAVKEQFRRKQYRLAIAAHQHVKHNGRRSQRQ